jgi:hypothetical protein
MDAATGGGYPQLRSIPYSLWVVMAVWHVIPESQVKWINLSLFNSEVGEDECSWISTGVNLLY